MFAAAWQAQDALHELTVRLHYPRQGYSGMIKKGGAIVAAV